ncbi:hypothetical protein BHM03_00022151 [Ensete ventricosum]|nr:hypothetical protein BHM03_00022151 [Ensete ventricosum]
MIDFDRQLPISAEGGRKKKKEKKRRKGRTWSPVLLSRSVATGDFFSPRGEKERGNDKAFQPNLTCTNQSQCKPTNNAQNQFPLPVAVVLNSIKISSRWRRKDEEKERRRRCPCVYSCDRPLKAGRRRTEGREGVVGSLSQDQKPELPVISCSPM